MSDKFIEIDNVFFSYTDEEENKNINVLSDINLKIKEGEFIALVGHNGCGKSTLAKLINGILKPTQGKISFKGIDTSDEELSYEIKKNIGLVLQNPDNQLIAGTVEEDVAFGPENLNLRPDEIRKRVDEALLTVGMYEHKDKAPHKLSGGQKQRVAIAGIIAMQPNCIIFDEATSMLDPNGRKEVLDTISYLNKEKSITIILITHHMDEVALADRVVVMEKGSIVMQGTPRVVFEQHEKLEKLKLDVPQATLLINLLKKRGMPFAKTAINNDECVEEILKKFN